ncbi:hypothetical protein [Polyangium sp. y55x31]|uniref:hypothetical protein n=1 Tax=Polyangium sp. y55x31 TaxID=3042688 RepID=UPI0024823481|nr:hypothetical protein [Polyangium sp. y55x31]MDI1482776.1 hypothetical protein [Polyangium sp. y55x31]
MIMHIEDGKYSLHHGDKVEVGRVVVTGGVEHWYLYTTRSTTHGVYTAPSGRREYRGRFPISRTSVLEFEYDGTFSLAGFDPTVYARSIPTTANHLYIKATCADLGEVTPIARPSSRRLGEGPSDAGQIDWGVWRILQKGLHVGYVDVAPYREADATSDRARETWMLFTSESSGYGKYTPPSASGGSYEIEYDREYTPTRPGATSIPRDLAYRTILADCNIPTLDP